MGSLGFFPGIAVLAFLEASGFIKWVNVGEHVPVDAGTKGGDGGGRRRSECAITRLAERHAIGALRVG